MKSKQNAGILYAVLAAALYALSTPFSKLMLTSIPPRIMASLVYIGAGLGMAIVGGVQRLSGHSSNDPPLSWEDWPYVVGMIVLDIAAPILLMLGLRSSSAASVSLLNNFEIVATSIIALTLFKEAISKRLWAAIVCVTIASMLLSIEEPGSLSFSMGSLFVLLACGCWGMENNCTRKLSRKDPLEIVVLKGIGSGSGALIIALLCGESLAWSLEIIGALVLGFLAYGLSIFFYVRAQACLGTAKTSAFYAIAPFVGSALSLILFREQPGAFFWIALLIMALGAYLAANS